MYVHIFLYIFIYVCKYIHTCIYTLSVLHCVYFQYVDLYMTMQVQINSFKIFVCVSLSLPVSLSFSLSDIALNALLCSGVLQCVAGCCSVLQVVAVCCTSLFKCRRDLLPLPENIFTFSLHFSFFL